MFKVISIPKKGQITAPEMNPRIHKIQVYHISLYHTSLLMFVQWIWVWVCGCAYLALILTLCLQRTALFLGGFSVTGQYPARFAAGVGHVLPHTRTYRGTERAVRVDKVCTAGQPKSSYQILIQQKLIRCRSTASHQGCLCWSERPDNLRLNHFSYIWCAGFLRPC